MRIVRVARPDGPAFGVLQDDYVALLTPHPFTDFSLTDQMAPVEKVRLLAPIIPSKVLCVGRNYAAHAAEMGNELPSEPLIFSKPATSVIGPNDAIKLPRVSEDVQHEAEIAVVMKRITRKVSPADALDHILGYTCANDVTARDLQRRDGQWTRAKGFDTFCPIGPWIETELDVAGGVAVRALVGSEVRQGGSSADLIFSIPDVIAYISAFTTLLPGDVILTGTPEGVGPLHAGDTVTVEVEGIGALSNPVEADD